MTTISPGTLDKLKVLRGFLFFSTVTTVLLTLLFSISLALGNKEAVSRRWGQTSARVALVSLFPFLLLNKLLVDEEDGNGRLEDAGKLTGTNLSVCVGCDNYLGHCYSGSEGTNRFVCGMHPYGPTTDFCPDFEVEPTSYVIIRMQGMSRRCFYLIKNESWTTMSLVLIQEGFEIWRIEDIDALCKRYRLKSATGLPGVTFTSKATNAEDAFKEMMADCNK